MLIRGIALVFFWSLAAISLTFWSYALLVLFVNLFHLLVMTIANRNIACYSPIDLQWWSCGIYLFVFHLGYGIGTPLLGSLAKKVEIRFMVVTGGVIVVFLLPSLLRTVKRQSI